MSTKNYWRPHYVIEEIEHNGSIYFQVSIREVHYENDEPILWSANPCEIISGEYDEKESLEDIKGLMEIYYKANENCVYKVNENDELEYYSQYP
ncbi:hypothetical protein PBI_SCTP2_285 [Salicola phage SCTP-2]|nr:hypothetical protein PBI_SCTP2_285 [Salicola phage SCTP-2]